MKMHFGKVVEVKDLGKHPAATAVRLGILLAGGVDVTPDPKRKNFYDVDGGSTVYYIHVSPVSGTIFLLACWKKVAWPAPRVNVAQSLQPIA